MANKSKVQSVEPDIADLVNGWLKSYGLDYKLEQASLNSEIDTGLGENDRIYLVAATIIATLGAEGVKPLEKSDLGSSTESGETDGDKIIRKITSFLKKKQLPQQKQDLIIRTLSNTLVDENRNKPENGESQIKRVFNTFKR